MPSPGVTIARPGDILGVRGTGPISRAILWASRTRGERETAISHVGLIASHARLPDALVIEAAGGSVREARVRDYYGKGQGLVLLRPRNLTPAEISLLVTRAGSKIGERYGYGDIVLHALARLGFGWAVRLITTRRPICSVLVADAFQALGYSFGVPAHHAQPDDIFDFAIRHPEKYELPLGEEPVALWW